LKSGVPVRPILLDNIRRFPAYFKDYQTMVLSYEIMKPKTPDMHLGLSEWIHNGGNMVYVGDHSDDYHLVREWWNEGDLKYEHPAEHLFAILGLDSDLKQGTYKIGEGSISFLPIHPRESAYDMKYATAYKSIVRKAVEHQSKASLENIWEEKNYLLLRRGPYVIGSVLDESINDEPLKLNGLYVDLLDHNLTIREQMTITPGEQILLYDLNFKKSQNPFQLIASASRVDKLKTMKYGVKFTAEGHLE